MKKNNRYIYREVRLLNRNDDAIGILPLLATIIAIIGAFIVAMSYDLILLGYDLILLGVVILMALTIAIALKIDKLAATSILLILFALLVIRFFNIS